MVFLEYFSLNPILAIVSTTKYLGLAEIYANIRSLDS